MLSTGVKRRSDPSHPSNDPIKTAWEEVVLKGHVSVSGIRPEVLSSWLLCRDMGLDPFSKTSPPVLSGRALNKLLNDHRDLLTISKPVIDMIEISVRDTGFIITLTEKEGHVLVVRGDGDVLQMAEQNSYLPGCLRTVEHAGTNAIGVSLSEGRPIQLTGAEHFKVQHHPWTCSSAPIHNGQGSIIGAITLSGSSIGRHKHTLALVTAAADTIGSQLRERDLLEEKQRLNSMLTLIFNAFSDGVVAVDNDLEIVRMNKAASAMLGLDDKVVMGKRLSGVVGPEDTLIKALSSKNYFTGVETAFKCPLGTRSYICSIDPVRDHSGHILGAILRMAEKRQLISIAKRISGNYAKYQFKDIKGNDPALLRQIELAKIASRTNSRILIIGKSGTGKELFAQAIHNYSSRQKEPFVAISCAAIPRDLIESELFGYRGGAFTGANRDGQVGKFEFANRGTLFLDEINRLPLDLQAKLLRVLQQNEIVRLGDSVPIPVDVRVIAASNTDLQTEVEQHNFREDLYYRINVVEIFIPPLRERKEDLDLLIDHIMQRQWQEMGEKKPRISVRVMNILRNYRWPGNIRELENCMERAMLISQGETIQDIHLPERIRKTQDGPDRGIMSLHQGLREMIEGTLIRCGGNVSRTARELKIARSTLYRKMREFGLK